MSCLTHEQILFEAFGLERDVEVSRHLQSCRACREQVETYRTLPRRVVARLCRDESDHEAAKDRLLAALPDRHTSHSAGSPVGVGLSSNRRPRLGEIVMRHRIAFVTFGGTAVTTAALVLVWALMWSHSLSAMEQTAEAIRKAKSYQCDVVVKGTQAGPKPKKARMYWQGDWFRHEMLEAAKAVHVDVFSRKEQGLTIDHRRKTFHRNNAKKGQLSPLLMVANLGNVSGEADQDLGSKRIGNIEAAGFRIAMEKVDPNVGPDGTLTVWVAVDSKLPVVVEWEHPALGTCRMDNFQWDVALSAELFHPQPPDDYKDITRAPPKPDEQVAAITAALKIYADAFDGQYPQTKMVTGDITSFRLGKRLGMPDSSDAEAFELFIQRDAYLRYLEAMRGFATINAIQRENSDSAYFGKTVGPVHFDKVLFYWKLDDGRYVVIYGDLHSSTLAKDRLQSLLEKK